MQLGQGPARARNSCVFIHMYTSLYLVAGLTDRTRSLLRGWWKSYSGHRIIDDDFKVIALSPCYVYRGTPEMVRLLQYLKLKEGDNVVVSEFKPLDWGEITAAPVSSEEGPPSSSEDTSL